MGGTPTEDNTATSGAMTNGSVFVDGSVSNSYTPSGSPSLYPIKMSINTVAKQSVVTFTKGSSAATVPHGLGVRPTLIIFKNRSRDDTNWCCWHTRAGTARRVKLNERGIDDNTQFFDNDFTNCDEHHFHVGTGQNDTGADGDVVTAYCFADVEGYFRAGDYVSRDKGGSNGFVNGRFVYTGFKPAFLQIRRRDNTSTDCLRD